MNSILLKWYAKLNDLQLKLFSPYDKRLTGACNRSPGSKMLSITTQLHCGDEKIFTDDVSRKHSNLKNI
jgi:hypothetical protein